MTLCHFFIEGSSLFLHQIAEAFDLRGIIASMTTLTSIGIQNTLQTKAPGRFDEWICLECPDL
jgi:hypothetical protein